MKGWTAKDIKTVRERWDAGYSYGQIAEMFEGKSRNAVAGLIRRVRERDARPKRLGTDGSVKSFLPRPETAPKKAMKPVKIKPAPLPPDLACDPVSLLERKMDQCAYPLDADGSAGPDMQCCGRPVEFGYSWCLHHRQIVFAVGAQ